jgi:type I restriction enzyme S subunit
MIFNEVLKQEIPKGWEDCLLEDVCIIHDSIRKPLSGDERSTRKGPYPYYGAVSIVDYIDSFLFDGIYLLFSEDGIYVVDEFGHPTIQYVWGKFWVNNHAHILQGNGDVTTEFILLALSYTNVSHLVTGAAQPKINQKNMASIPMFKPIDGALKQFTKLIDPFFRHIRITADILRQLSTLRDMLLLRVVAHESDL